MDAEWVSVDDGRDLGGSVNAALMVGRSGRGGRNCETERRHAERHTPERGIRTSAALRLDRSNDGEDREGQRAQNEVNLHFMLGNFKEMFLPKMIHFSWTDQIPIGRRPPTPNNSIRHKLRPFNSECEHCGAIYCFEERSKSSTRANPRYL